LINFFYLSQYGEEDLAFEIHKINFISAFAAVDINTIHNLTLGIKDSTPFATEHQRLHPYCKRFLFGSEVAGGRGR
jgi:hypothetical protein